MEGVSHADARANARVTTAGLRAGSGSRSKTGASSSVRITETSMPADGARPVTPATTTAGLRRAMSRRRNFFQGSGAPRHDARRRASSLVEDREHQRKAAPSPGGAAARTGGVYFRLGETTDNDESLLHYQDVREELELGGHNLTSVLNNPRETFMDSLYEAAFEAEPPLPDLDVMRANLPKGLREVTYEEVKPYIRRTAALTKAFERNHGPSAAVGMLEDFKGGSGSKSGEASTAANGPSARLASLDDASLSGVEEAPRYGLGIRRFRNNGSLGSADGRSVAAAAAAAAMAGGALETTSTAIDSAENGVSIPVHGSKRGERHPGGKSSVAQCFEQVPGMFFESSFSLQDPAVFEEAVMAAGAEQPERLANYLDLVEVCLLKQISQRSSAFFEGLKTSQDLQMHVTGACTTLYQLRESMRRMEQEVAAGPMQVPKLQRRRNNLAALEATLELVAGVQQSQAAIQGLLAAEDYLGALDIIQSAKSTVKNELGKLQGLKNVGRQLTEYEGLVSHRLSDRFVSLAVTIPVDAGAAGSTAGAETARDPDADSWEMEMDAEAAEIGGGGSSGANSSGGDGFGSGDDLRRDLQLVVKGLLRLGEMEKVLGVVQDRLSEDLKQIIRTVVGDFLATTDDSGELMDTFHLFSDETEGGGESAGGGGGGAGAEDTNDNQARASAAADGQKMPKLKALDGEAFASCLEMCFEHMLSVLTRVSQIHAALASIVDSCANLGGEEPKENGVGQEGFRGEGRRLQGWDGQEEDGARGAKGEGSRDGTVGGGGRGARSVFSLTKEESAVIVGRSRSCLRALSELMERSVSQLLSVRREHNCTKLDVKEFKHLWDITVSFIQSVERLSRCNGYKLRSTLLSQAKAFVEARHEANKQTLVKRLDAEKWAQAAVTPGRQAVLDRLSSGNVFPSAKASKASSGEPSRGRAIQGSNGSSSYGYGNGTLGVRGDLPAQPNFVGGSRTGRKGERRREAVVGGVSYKAVGSALLVSEMAVNFLQFAADFPAIVTDVVTRISELLRVFNSRSTQLVLGAGAIHSAANLKSISAKHLALCSQSLGLVRSLIPYLKAALATRLPQKHHLLLTQMDTVAQDYRDHRDKIFSKFVSMIEELIDSRSSTLRLTNWDTPGGSDAGGSVGGGAAVGSDPCQFTADVRKAVTAMHNILQQQLPPEQLQAVFRRMFTAITRKVPACFQREGVSPSTEAGRQRILDDIGFACAALSTLRGIDSSTLRLEQAIGDLYGKGLGGASNGMSGGSSGSVNRSIPAAGRDAALGAVASDGRS